MTTFAIRCFKNGRRRKTHTFTKKEARCFLVAARHLAKYLKREYKLGKPRKLWKSLRRAVS